MAKTKKALRPLRKTTWLSRGTKMVPVYLTPAEHAKFRALADARGSSLSAMFRVAFLAQYPMA